MLLKFLKRWGKEKSGATAIEFSLLAIPYVFLSIGIIELSITYATGSLLEGATSTASRMVRTGQLQTGGGDQEDQFRTALCDYAAIMINCDDVQIEVVRMDDYGDYSDLDPVFDEDGNLVPRTFNAGGTNDKVLIRAVYRYHMMTPFVGPLLAGTDNTILFISTIVLQSEPYEYEEEDS